MKHSFVRSAALASILFLSIACADRDIGYDKLEPVHEGMPRDSVLLIMGSGPLSGQNADAVRVEQGYRKSQFMVDGKQYEVLFYREEPGNVNEPLAPELETPIVMLDGKVLGWGWKFYDGAVEQYRLPVLRPAK